MKPIELKDIIHLYIGAPLRYRYVDWAEGSWTPVCKMTLRDCERILMDASIDKFELILRPLDSMTEEEGIEIFGEEWTSDSPNARDIIYHLIEGDELRLTPNETASALFKGFDLFNAHSRGLCIYESETLK